VGYDMNSNKAYIDDFAFDSATMKLYLKGLIQVQIEK
jgi:hypothetical protein